MTGTGDKNFPVKLLKLGIAVVIDNPFEPNLLIDRVKSTMKKSKPVENQETLNSANQQLSNLIKIADTVSEGVAITDTDGNILYTNTAYENISGFNLEEIIERPLFREEAVPGFASLPRRVQDTLNLSKSWSGVVTAYRKSGESYREHRKLILLDGMQKSDSMIICVAHNDTHPTDQDPPNRESRKMESIGLLTTIVAHNLTNIVTPLLGYADLLRRDIEPDSTASHDLDVIEKAAKRARDLSTQILTIGRPRLYEGNTSNLQTVLEEVTDLFRAVIPNNINLCINIDSSPAMVAVDESDVHTILLNLLTNSCHAMPDGGLLHVSLTKVKLNGNPASGNNINSISRACIKVQDTGSGMDEYTMVNCFNRNFTTKGTHIGTGIGLYCVKEIVKNNNGAISLKSSIGKGSVFEVYFPISSE